jgi:hypothetical protein
MYDEILHAPLKKRFEVQKMHLSGNMTVPSVRPFKRGVKTVISSMETTMTGINALQWAKEISKLPDGCFTIAFFPYSKQKGEASERLAVREGCIFRTQLPEERFSIDGENFFLFNDGNGDPKMCYRILIRYMGFPQDGYKLHKIDWL